MQLITKSKFVILREFVVNLDFSEWTYR